MSTHGLPKWIREPSAEFSVKVGPCNFCLESINNLTILQLNWLYCQVLFTDTFSGKLHRDLDMKQGSVAFWTLQSGCFSSLIVPDPTVLQKKIPWKDTVCMLSAGLSFPPFQLHWKLIHKSLHTHRGQVCVYPFWNRCSYPSYVWRKHSILDMFNACYGRMDAEKPQKQVCKASG